MKDIAMTVEPLQQIPASPAERTTRRVFINDLILDCLIGVHRHERDGSQRIRINLDLTVFETPDPIDDKLANVLCYEDLIVKVRNLAAAGHVNLVETLAERSETTIILHLRHDGRIDFSYLILTYNFILQFL